MFKKDTQAENNTDGQNKQDPKVHYPVSQDSAAANRTVMNVLNDLRLALLTLVILALAHL